MWKRSIFMPLPPLPLPLPLPFYSSNTSSYPTHQNGSGQSLPHPQSQVLTIFYDLGSFYGRRGAHDFVGDGWEGSSKPHPNTSPCSLTHADNHHCSINKTFSQKKDAVCVDRLQILRALILSPIFLGLVKYNQRYTLKCAERFYL